MLVQGLTSRRSVRRDSYKRKPLCLPQGPLRFRTLVSRQLVLEIRPTPPRQPLVLLLRTALALLLQPMLLPHRHHPRSRKRTLSAAGISVTNVSPRPKPSTYVSSQYQRCIMEETSMYCYSIMAAQLNQSNVEFKLLAESLLLQCA